jgi:hypothetical protein
MGVVYEAVELALERSVALKVIAPELASDPGFRERFVAEARVAASIDHPNVLPVFGAGEDDGVLFLAMRFVAGDDLGTLVRRGGPLTPARAAAIVVQVGAALDAAHGRRLVHRDVKPANVLVAAGDHAYLTDFGLVRDLDVTAGRTRTGVVLGTPDYVAPEQIRGEAIGPWTDIYALGCVLFFALTGRVVFALDAPEAKLWAHLSEPPPAPSALRDGVPPALDDTVRRALAKSPSVRFASASALGAAALEATSQAKRVARRDDLAATAPGRRVLGDGRARAEEFPMPAPLRARDLLIGRTDELAAVVRAVRADGKGRARVVLVTGEAGIGKTSLVARAAADAGAVCVLYGRCDEEPLGPYQPFAEALRDLLAGAPRLRVDPALASHFAELARILPELGEAAGAPGDGDRHRLFEGVAALMGAAGDPLLFVLDDLHWADGPTMVMLRYVLRRARGALVVLATSRDAADAGGALADLVVDLRRDEALERIRLAGLDVAATEELIAMRIGAAPDPELVRRTHARTAGNPFFIDQLLRAAPDARVPEGIKELIAQRVTRLTPAAAETLRVAATVGAEFELELLERLVGGREQAVAAVDAALATGMVVEATGVAGRFAFVHALVREAIYEGMSATRRESLHQRIGEVLESFHDPRAAALAHHFLQARHVAGPDRAARWAIAAAEAAAGALAWEQEVAHYETALRVLDEAGSLDDATRGRILLALADRLAWIGGDFRGACVRAAELAKRHGWTDMLGEAAFDIARVHEYGVVDPQAVGLLEDALAAAGDRDSRWHARVLGRLAAALALDGRDPERRDALSSQGLEMARRLDDSDALMVALDSRAFALAGPDSLPEQIRLTSEAVQLAEAVGHEPVRALSLRAQLVGLRTASGDMRVARQELDMLARSVAANRLQGTYYEVDVLRMRAAFAVIDANLADAERLARATRALCERLGDPDAANLWIALMLPVRLEQDRADELADAIGARATRSSGHAPWRAALCLLHTRAGRTGDARAGMRALVADECTAVPRLHDWLGALTMLADACAELDDLAAADTLERLLRPYSRRVATFLYNAIELGPVARPLGRLAALLGRLDDGVALLEGALGISQAVPAPVWVARAQADLGGVLLQRGAPGDRDRAHALLECAHARALELGLRRLARDTEPPTLAPRSGAAL